MNRYALLTDQRVPANLRASLQSIALEADMLISRGVTIDDATPSGLRLRNLGYRSRALASEVAPYITTQQVSAPSVELATGELPPMTPINEPADEEPDAGPEVPWDAIAIGLGAMILIGGVVLIAL